MYNDIILFMPRVGDNRHKQAMDDLKIYVQNMFLSVGDSCPVRAAEKAQSVGGV